MVAKARKSTNAKASDVNTVTPVMTGLMRNMRTRATAAASSPPSELDEPGADEVPHAFDVAHDPRHEVARLVRVVEGDGQPARRGACTRRRRSAMSRCAALERIWVRAKDVRAWTTVAPTTAPRIGRSRSDLPLADHVVDEVARGGGQDEAGHAVDRDEDEAEEQQVPPRPHQRPELRPQRAKPFDLRALGLVGRVSSTPTRHARGAPRGPRAPSRCRPARSSPFASAFDPNRAAPFLLLAPVLVYKEQP